jgi:hypothetical protein
MGVITVRTQQARDDVEIVPATLDGCHTNTRNIANLGALAQTTKDKVYVVAHPGTGESAAVNRRRLHDIKTGFAPNFDPKKIILSEGERVKGPGRVDFFLGSEHNYVAIMPRNGGFWSTCAEDRKQTKK